MAVAISHDCDISNDNLDAEPFVEFIFARIVTQPNGNFTHGKNPRTLHLEYKQGETTIVLELIASKRTIVSKTLLEAIQTDQIYQLSSRYILQSWLAARYRRHALPNSLVNRLRSVFSYIEKEGKKNSSGILSFRLSYEPQDEIPPEEPYELWINIIYVTDKPEHTPMAEKIAHSIESEFPKLMEKTKEYGKVDLRRCEAISEEEFTLRDMRETVEYHLEHLSHRTDPPEPTVYS
ncbi:MAG: hypothetical protein HC852_18810 [Acaryochloridaceae cyanobacterium RU_4_10]|nr:hypothetical protein [Acaryochloridaceae cyanobacterium RU_4_10]